MICNKNIKSYSNFCHSYDNTNNILNTRAHYLLHLCTELWFKTAFRDKGKPKTLSYIMSDIKQVLNENKIL